MNQSEEIKSAEATLNSKQRILANLKKMANAWKKEIPGKSADRVPKYYHNEKRPNDFHAEYNMLLMDGITCKSCINCKTCVTMFGQKETDTSCQWHPNRFQPLPTPPTN